MRIELPFEEWESEQLPAFTGDVMWKMVSLRVALYLLDLARLDVEAMRGQFAMERVASQLFSAVGSIGANLTEGFGRQLCPIAPAFSATHSAPCARASGGTRLRVEHSMTPRIVAD